MDRPAGPRLRDAMPRPLLFVFLAASVLAIAAVVFFLVKPPALEPIPLAERRPPGTAELSHDVGEISPASIPRRAVPFEPPCEEVAGVRVRAGAAGVARLTAVLEHACTFAGPSLDADTRAAVSALGSATIRFGRFAISGVESAAEGSTIWLNISMSSRDLPVTHVVPVLLHEALHLGASGPPGAAAEYRARLVEDRVCRELIDPGDRPRWCQEASQITSLAEAEAVDLLVRAGYLR